METTENLTHGKLIFKGAFGNEFVLYHNFPLDILQRRTAELIRNGRYKKDDLTIRYLEKPNQQ